MRSIGQAQRGIAGQIGGAQAGLGEATGRARGITQQAIGQLRGSDAQFDPSGIAAFMDPFTREVIEAEQAEIARLGEKQLNQARAQQAAAGAFGGSRGAIQEAEIGRNVLEQQARTGAQLRSQGFQQAAQQAQAASRQRKADNSEPRTGRPIGPECRTVSPTWGTSWRPVRFAGPDEPSATCTTSCSTGHLYGTAPSATGATSCSDGTTARSSRIVGSRTRTKGRTSWSALGLQGQQALAQMAGQRANIAQQGGQLVCNLVSWLRETWINSRPLRNNAGQWVKESLVWRSKAVS